MNAFRMYAPDELARDGYPMEWHATIKHAVRAEAGDRCVRCHHPYKVGAHEMEREVDEEGNVHYVSWTPCDEECSHHDDAPVRVMLNGELHGYYRGYNGGLDIARAGWDEVEGAVIEARARILTVHHLDGDKANCRWWNLAALCQRCHLTIQGRVVISQSYPWEHSEWFKPYAAGYYAFVYLGEDLDRAQVEARMDELLALERVA